LFYICCDCKVDTLKNKESAYIVKNKIWKLIKNPRFICIKCLEIRLKRKLISEDFDWKIPLTFLKCFTRSKLLLSRMGVKNNKFKDISLNDYALQINKKD
jgi:hypothetical protein